MFFNKPKAKVNFLNDLDQDVFNLFQVIRTQPDELRHLMEITPYHDTLFQHWRKEQESDPVWKAVRFIYLSNFGYMGKTETMSIDDKSAKKHALQNLQKTIDFLSDCSVRFSGKGFQFFLKQLSMDKSVDQAFIYSDPPYLGTTNNYSDSFTEQDSEDLFNSMEATGCKWAMSEFDHPLIMQQAHDRGLNVHVIGERRNLNGKRRTEVLVTNYRNAQISIW